MKKVIALAAVVVVCGGIYLLNRNPTAHEDKHHGHTHDAPAVTTTDPNTESADEHEAAHTHLHEQTSGTLPTAISTFNYKQEAQEVLRLAKEWPSSRAQLLNKTLSEDPFKLHNISVAPHTHNEILQRQMGAIKIMSLRILLQNEKSKTQKLQDLDYIAKNSKDITLQNIATEARKSELNNRPFFEDTLNAISND